jgi:uncharacterized protein (TIGR02996 family)
MRTVIRLYPCIAVSVLTVLAAGCGSAAERKAAYIAHGEKYMTQHNYEKARIEFGNALQIDPKDARAHYLAGQVAEKLDNPRAAVGQYQAAVDLDPKQSQARAAMARLYVLGGIPDKAMEVIAPGLTAEPQNAALLTARAAAKAAANDLKGASEDAESAYRTGGDANEYTIALLASLYQRQSQADKARETVRAGIERIPDNVDLRTILADLDVQSGQHLDEAEAQLKKTIELEPKAIDHRFVLARYYLLCEDADAAEHTLRDAITAFPKNAKAKRALIEMLAGQRGADKAQAELEKFVKAEPDNDDLKLELADYLQAQKKIDEAEVIYRKVIEHARTDADGLTARNRLAFLALKRNDVAASEKLIAEVIEASPHDANALAMRSDIELARGDASAAITDLRTVLRDQPNSLPLLRALARAHLQNNEPALAEEALQSAVQANPKDKDARLELADVLGKNGKPDQARAILEQMVAEAPDNLQLREQLFRIQARQDDLTAARATAETIKRTNPTLALGYFLAGVVDEKEKKADAASEEYAKALSLQPQGAEPLEAIVKLDMARKQPQHALDRLGAMIQKYPDNMLARSLKGDVLTAQGQYDQAVQIYQQAIDHSPHLWSLYRGLAFSQIAGKRDDAAIEALSKGIDQNPDAGELRLDLALLYERLKRPDDAIGVYEAMLKHAPDSLTAANNLAMLLVNYKQDSASLTRAQQLAAQLEKTKSTSFIDTRGWVAYKSGNYRDAVTLLTQAADKAPQSPELQYHLGMAQWKSADVTGAQRSLQAAIAAGKPFPGIDEARSALDQIHRGG